MPCTAKHGQKKASISTCASSTSLLQVGLAVLSWLFIGACSSSALMRAMLVMVTPALRSRLAMSSTALPAISPLVLTRIAGGACTVAIDRAASSSTRIRSSGSPAPAKTTAVGGSAVTAAYASATALATSSVVGSKPSGSGMKPLEADKTNPGPRDSISETLLQRFVSATKRERPSVYVMPVIACCARPGAISSAWLVVGHGAFLFTAKKMQVKV